MCQFCFCFFNGKSKQYDPYRTQPTSPGFDPENVQNVKTKIKKIIIYERQMMNFQAGTGNKGF